MAKTGYTINTDIKRLPRSFIEQFLNIPASTLSDCMGRFNSMSYTIKPFGGKARLAGSAFTVRTSPSDNLLIHKALDMAEEGDVIVVGTDTVSNHALLGALMGMTALHRGIAGLVIDGLIRDCQELREMDLPVYAKGAVPAGPYKNGPGEINVPVVCGGVAVNPGDVIVGDHDGIVVIPPDDAERVLKEARAIMQAEKEKVEQITKGTLDTTWIQKSLDALGYFKK